MLEIIHVSKSYKELLAVDDISFSVKKGEIYGLVGSNGSGKSTTFRMILQLLQPDAGVIQYLGKPMAMTARSVFGYLPEERSLYRDISVRRQLIFLAQLKGMQLPEIHAAIAKWSVILEMEPILDSRIKCLSKGNQQKVQIMGTLLHQPEIYIFDEPFSGLDTYYLELIKQVFLQLKKEGSIILFSTHRLEHIETFCHEMLYLRKGKTICQGEINAIRQRSGYRCIRIQGGVQYHQLKEIEGVTCIKKDGNMFQFLMKEDLQAKKVAMRLIKSSQCIQMEYCLPSLHDVLHMQVQYE